MPRSAPPRPPTRRGACPGVLDPMEAADGWLVRVRIPAGRLTADELRLLADIADGVGSGTVEITSRANVQLRGIAERTLPTVGARLVAAGLTAPDAAADARRAVVASPLAGHDPSELVDVTPIVDAVLQALAAADLPALPPKFGITIDGGGAIGVRDVPCSLGLAAVGPATWQLTPGTAGAEVATVVTTTDPSALAAAILAAIPTADPGHRNRPPSSAVAVAAAASTPTADPGHRNRPPSSAVAIAAAASTPTADPGHRNRPRSSAVAVAAAASTPTADPGHRNRPPASAVDRAVGVLAHRRSGAVNVIGRAAIGRTTAATLARLADLADRADAVRTTPGGVALLGVADPLARSTVDALGTLGLVVDPDDPRSGISACIGAPGCASARADTVVAAADMADRRGTTRGPAAAIHLAACEKRCGAPLGATVLIADDRGRFVVAGAAG